MTLERRPIMQAGIYFRKENAFPPGQLLLVGQGVVLYELIEDKKGGAAWHGPAHAEPEPGETLIYMGIMEKNPYTGLRPRDGGPEHLVLRKGKLYTIEAGEFAEVKE